MWTKDIWGFPPVDLSTISSASRVQNSGSNETTSGDFGPFLNVTMNSQALSGMIKCSASGYNTSHWILTDTDLNNNTIWNVTVNPTGLDSGYEFSSYIRFNGLLARTPEQTVSGNETINIEQWLPYGYGSSGDEWENDASSQNFTVVWLNSGYPQAYKDNTGDYHFIFANMPKVQALNCMPIFEKANVSITVNVADGTVESYQLLDTPVIAI